MRVIVTNEENEDRDIGSSLAALRSPKAAPTAIARAVSYIETTIFDQGVAGPNTIQAIPHLIDVLRARGKAAAKARVLRLLGEIHQNPARADAKPYRRAVAAANAPARALLDDADKNVRMYAAFVVGQLPGKAAGLAGRANVEKDPLVRATLAYAAALQERRAPRALVGDTHPVVRAAAGLGSLLVDGKALGDAAVAGALLAAADDAALDRTELPFHRELRRAVIAALGRHGHGHDAVVDALIAKLPEEAAADALAALAAPSKDKKIIVALLEHDRTRSLAKHGLPHDPIEVQRLVGLAPPARAPSIDAKTKRAVLALVTNRKPFDASKLVASLAARTARERFDIAIDVAEGNAGISDCWSDRDNVKSWHRIRREVRAFAIARTLLLADDVDLVWIDDQLAVLGELVALGGGKQTGPRALLAMCRALRAVRAKQRIPNELIPIIGGSWSELVRFTDDLRELVVTAQGDGLARALEDFAPLHELADLSRVALARLIAEQKKDSREGFEQATLPHRSLARLVATYDRRALAPLLKELAKRTDGDGPDLEWNGTTYRTAKDEPAAVDDSLRD
jgi:hypothetical protein